MSDTKKIEYKFPCRECNKDIDRMKCVEHNVMFCEKTLAEHDKQIRADAIEEFFKAITEHTIVCTDGVTEVIDVMDIIKCKEQLKEQK